MAKPRSQSQGQNIPEGQKSVAYAFNYRHPERTLKDKEVDKVHNKVEQLKSKLSDGRSAPA